MTDIIPERGNTSDWGLMSDNTMTAPCPRCGKRLRFGPEALGRKGRCLSCSQKLAVLGNGRVYAIERPHGLGSHGCAGDHEITDKGQAESPTRGQRGSRADQLVLLAMLALALLMLRNWLRDGRSNVPGSEVTAPAVVATSVSLKTEVPASDTNAGSPSNPPPPMVMSWEPDPPAAGLSSVDDPGGGTPLPKPVETSDLLSRGLAHCHDGRYSEGLHCLDQVVFYDPDNAQAHYYRGRVLCCLGRYSEAVTAYERSLAIDPQRSVVRPHLAGALAVLQQAPPPNL
ncbi:MAG: tetratricopeptide repeat protein [Planctomycetes bacterium]|nr:tetratricopeptide repeat protein [Planctomycetota bacterium]